MAFARARTWDAAAERFLEVARSAAPIGVMDPATREACERLVAARPRPMRVAPQAPPRSVLRARVKRLALRVLARG
jgi:hypothetical protein